MLNSLKDTSDIMAIGGLGAKDILIQLKGDNKDFKNAMSDSDKSMNSLTNSVKRYGPAMAAAFAVGTAALIASSVKMAAAEEVVNRQTESMLKSQGVMWSEVKGDVTDYINELERLTAYGDTDLQMAFNRMSSSGLEFNEVMKSMDMVTDIAYTRNIDLVAAADLVSKAYNGQGSALKRYGIILENGLTGMEALNAMQVEVNDNFSDAADRTETLEGKMDSLTDATDDFKEAVGEPMLEPLTKFVGKLAEGTTESEGFATSLGNIGASFIEDWLMPKDPLSELRKSMEIDEDSAYSKYLDKLQAGKEFNGVLQEQLDIENEITEEGEKQLTTMRERAAEKRKEIQAARESSGTSLTGLTGSATAYASGGSYTRTSGAHTISSKGNDSGAP